MANLRETMERELAPRRFSLLDEIPAKPSLRPDETANLLGCSEFHIRHLVEEGSLVAVDIRSAVCPKPSLRISRASLVAFIERRKTV
ncbi:MAG: helix-turn-helix domain-containing protein [Kiritimatiellaeota bacterium]|nr:helix-turn-helix domain-containing protein [Kiritimatiellota bacterium]